MSYLFIDDFKKLIQESNLQQVINSDPTILNSAMLDAQEMACEKLVQKYVLDQELADTNPYNSILSSYIPGNRVYLDASAYNTTVTYNTFSLTLWTDGSVYQSNQDGVTGAWDPTKWIKLGIQYSIFYIKLPNPLFDLNKYYVVGNQVYWKGNIYTCVIATTGIDHSLLIQYQQYNNVPLLNIFPDDPLNGIQFWGIAVPATIAAGSLPGMPWTAGDNRCRSLVRACVRIALYIVHARISPKNIPEIRSVDYMGREEDRINAKDEVIYPEYCALGWLQSAGRGGLTAGLQPIQPRSGGRIRWGSDVKFINGY